MKKNLLIGFLSLVSVASLTFGYHQKVEAERQRAIAIENEKLASDAQREAQIQRDMASMALEQSERARREAELQWHRAEAAQNQAKK